MKNVNELCTAKYGKDVLCTSDTNNIIKQKKIKKEEYTCDKKDCTIKTE